VKPVIGHSQLGLRLSDVGYVQQIVESCDNLFRVTGGVINVGGYREISVVSSFNICTDLQVGGLISPVPGGRLYRHSKEMSGDRSNDESRYGL
jgi:hypothetical protein